MKEQYKSNSDMAYDTYRKTYRYYPSFYLGILCFAVLAAGFVYDMYNLYLWVDYGCGIMNILLHIFIATALIAACYPAFLYTRSGSRRELIDKEEALLSLYPDHLSIRYSLTKSEKKKYRAQRINVYYCDITSMTYQHKFRRLKIDGDYAVEEVPLGGKSFEDAEVKDVESKSVYIYCEFDRFESVMDRIEQLSFKKIQYDDNVH